MSCNFSLGATFSNTGIMGRQHDLAEFVTRLMQHCQAMVFRGRWKARLKIGEQLQTFDRGSCEQIISLDVPDIGPWPLQDLIDAWDEKAHVDALVSATHWLALRLSRFQHNADGLVKVRTLMRWVRRFKCHVSVKLSKTVRVRYAVRAFAVRLGSRVDSGHERALHCSSVGGLRYCDDNTRAEPLSNFDDVACDVYVVLLSRTD